MSVRVRGRGGKVKVRGAPLSQLGLPPNDQKLEVEQPGNKVKQGSNMLSGTAWYHPSSICCTLIYPN